MSAVGEWLPSGDLDDNAAVTVAANELGARAARGTAAALISQIVSAAIYAASSIALARLLSPEDFGVFAISFAVVGVLEIAQHGGLIVPLVQTRTLTQSQLATLFWFCAGVGALQAACGLIAAPLVSWLYADPRLTAPIASLAAGCLVTGLTTTQLAVMRRRMHFGRLAVLEVSAVAGGAIVAVASARLGAGYWSLVYLQVARQVLLCGLLLIAGDVRWPRFGRAEIAPLVRFGRTMVAFEAVGFANSKLDNLILGWFAGPGALGFYTKAYEFILLTTNQIKGPIDNVVHATLSRVQDDPRRFQRSVLTGSLLTASIAVPLMVFVATHAPLVFAILFGQKWLPSAAIFRALMPGALVMTITASVGWIFVSLGRAERQLPFAMMTSVLTVIAFFVGAHWGAFGVAVAFSVCRLALSVPTLMFTCAGTPVDWFSIVRASARPLAASAVAALASSALAPILTGNLVSFAILTSVFAACYAASWLALPGGVSLMREQLVFVQGVYRNV